MKQFEYRGKEVHFYLDERSSYAEYNEPLVSTRDEDSKENEVITSKKESNEDLWDRLTDDYMK